MEVWAALASFVLVMIGRTEAAQKAVISLDPPWTAIFTGHMVTLTCNVPGRPQAYYWSKYSNFVGYGRTREIRNAEKSDSGVYRCSSTYTDISDPITLTVSNEYVILQAPYYAVFEGDELRLNCPAWAGSTVTSVRFYKNSEFIQGATEKTFTIEDAKTSDSGEYKCAAHLKWHGENKSNTQRINVQVLFTPPQLKSTPQRALVEGEKVTLECYTELNPQKANVELLYSFYKDGVQVKKQSSLPEFVIAAAELSDGGDYTCVVQSAYKRARKQSSSVEVRVQRIPVSGISMKVLPQSGEVIEGERLTLNCSVVQGTGTITFAWCRWALKQCINRVMVTTRWAEHTIEAMTEKDAGMYYCSASNNQPSVIISRTVQIHMKLRMSKPILTLEADRDGAVVGDTVVIQCSSQRGSAPIEYRFYLQGRYVGAVQENQTQPGRYTMTIGSLNEAGIYYCEADNGIQDGVQRSENVTLSVIVPVSGAKLRIDRASPEVLVGENLTLTCTVAFGSSPAFDWLHNEEEVAVASGMYQLLSPGNSLHIKSVQAEHGGSYVCQARNQLNYKRTFNSTSNVLSIEVIEENNALLIGVATLGPLVVIVVIAIVVFVFCKQKKKTDDRYFTAPASNHQIPVQRAPVSPSPSVSTDPAQLYSTVSRTAPSRNNTDVVYAVIDTKAKRRPPTANLQENLDYYVTYSSVKIGRHDKAAGSREFDEAKECDHLYENFQNK